MSVFRGSNTPDTDWSVPVQRTPYPPRLEDPDGPTERIYLPEDYTDPDTDVPLVDEPRRRGRAVTVAVVLAVLALAASAAASWVAWQALGRANAAMPMPTPAPAPAPAVASPSVSASADDTPMVYAQEPVRLTADCGASVRLDVDGAKPRAGGPAGDGDLRFDNRCGHDGALLAAGDGAQAVSHVSDAYTDRPGCADAVRTDRLDRGDSVPVTKGAVLCVQTASTLALVEVTGVGPAGTADLRVTGWRPLGEVVPSGGASPGE
jgi:hypothetical protein